MVRDSWFVADFLGFGVVAQPVLKLPQPVRFTAEIHASVDGGETFLLEVLPRPREPFKTEYPPAAKLPGVHHVRLQARITYENDGDIDVPQETRNLRGDGAPTFRQPDPDPVPGDKLAFRVINPEKAPKGLVDAMRSTCAPICRGY